MEVAWSVDRLWPLAAGVTAAAVALAASVGTPNPGRRRLVAAGALRALAILLASAAACGPHALTATVRPRRLLVALPPGAAPPPRATDRAGWEELTLLEVAALPARAAAAAAALRQDEDSRVAILVAAGDAVDDSLTATAAALRARGVPVFVLVAAPPGAAPEGTPAGPLLLGASVPAAPSPAVPVRVLLRWAPGAAEEGAIAEVDVDGVPAATGLTPADPAPTVRVGAGLRVIGVVARDRDGRPRGRALVPLRVGGEPRVLLIEEGENSDIAAALAAAGIPVEHAAPGAVPPAAGFAVAIVGAGARGDAALEAAVRSGLGLLALGGPRDGTGAGRFRDGGLAAALPVFLPPPAREPPPPPEPPAPPPEEPPPADPGPETRLDEAERPGAVVTLLVVVDTSGSMLGLKMEMARRAAAAAAATLDPRDRFGLLAFSDGYRWGVPLGPAGDDRAIAAALRALEPAGGTDVLPALREARRALLREETGVRHVVILSDGAMPFFGLSDAVDALVAEGATLSTVGIGDDYDARLLGALAARGRGGTYAAVDPRSLPRILTLDARTFAGAAGEAARRAPGLPAPPETPAPAPGAAAAGATRRPPEGGPPPEAPTPSPPSRRVAVPVVAGDPVAALEGLGPWPDAVPPDTAADPRPATAVALRFRDGGDGPAALVLGRHGLGRTAFLATDASGGDPPDVAGAWPAWAGYAPFLARLVRALATPPDGPGAEVVAVTPGREGTEVDLLLRGEGTAAPPRVEVLLAAGDAPARLPVTRLGERLFRASLPPAAPGPRILLVATPPDADPAAVSVADPGPPPVVENARDEILRLAAATGLTVIEGPLPPPPPPRAGAPARRSLLLPLLVAAAAAFAADTALRRHRTA